MAEGNLESTDEIQKVEEIIKRAFPNIENRPERFGKPRARSYAEDVVFASESLPTYYSKFIDKKNFERLARKLEEIEEIIEKISGQGEELLKNQIDLFAFTNESPLRNLQVEANKVQSGIQSCLSCSARREPDPRTNWRAISVMERCCMLWTAETGKRFPSLNNNARHDSPFGRFVAEIYGALQIGYEPGVALKNLMKWRNEVYTNE